MVITSFKKHVLLLSLVVQVKAGIVVFISLIRVEWQVWTILITILYYCIIKPILTYGYEPWESSLPSNSNRIQFLQSLILVKSQSTTPPYVSNSVIHNDLMFHLSKTSRRLDKIPFTLISKPIPILRPYLLLISPLI